MNLILSKVFRILFVLYLFIGFTIFNDGGFLAVRAQNGTVERTSIPVSFLPREDACRLEAGIACEDEKELARVLENYIS